MSGVRELPAMRKLTIWCPACGRRAEQVVTTAETTLALLDVRAAKKEHMRQQLAEAGCTHASLLREEEAPFA